MLPGTGVQSFLFLLEMMRLERTDGNIWQRDRSPGTGCFRLCFPVLILVPFAPTRGEEGVEDIKERRARRYKPRLDPIVYNPPMRQRRVRDPYEAALQAL